MIKNRNNAEKCLFAFNIVLTVLIKLTLVYQASDNAMIIVQQLFCFPVVIALDFFILILSHVSCYNVILLAINAFISIIVLVQLQEVQSEGFYMLHLHWNIISNWSFMEFLMHFLLKQVPLLSICWLISFAGVRMWNGSRHVDILLLQVDKGKLDILDFVKCHQNLLIMYCIVILLFQPTFDLNKNLLLSAIIDCFLWISSQLLQLPFHLSTSDSSTNPWQYPSDFQEDWTMKKKDELPLINAKFKNIVLIVVESLSASFFPRYNYSSTARPMAKQRTIPSSRFGIVTDYGDALEIQPHSVLLMPFIQSILQQKGQSIVSKRHMASSSYTIKALISILCGVPPLNTNYNLEMGFKIPKKCLPDILKQSNSIFLQPSDIYFDGQMNIIDSQMKFQTIVHRQTIKQRHPDLDETNYFGYGDRDLLPFIEDYVEKIQKQASTSSKPNIMTILTSVTHHPWHVPASHLHLLHEDDTTDQTINQYMACIRYTDQFIKDVVQKFSAEMGDKTLFVITGDHGVSMGKNNLYGAVNNWRQSAFEVPLVLFSQRKQWAMDYHNSLETTTHADILPTILDLVHGEYDQTSGDEYEGLSLVRPVDTRERLLIQTVSPGNTFIVVIQNYRKAVFEPSLLFKYDKLDQLNSFCLRQYQNCKMDKLINLQDDPEENDNLLKDWFEYGQEKKKFKGSMATGRTRLLEWFETKARHAAFHFVRRNRIKYGYFYSNN